MEIGGRDSVVFATEGVGPACLVDVETLAVSHIWEEPGGTMCMVPVPGLDSSFLAVQKFYFGFNSAESLLAYCHPTGTGWQVDKVFDLPYLHRFDLLCNGDRVDFVGGVLCRSKKEKNDWSDPGYITVGRVNPQDMTAPIPLQIVQDKLTKNHGYSKVVDDGVEKGLFAAQEGVFLVTPPVGGRADWQVEHIFDRPASEAQLFDLDGDGVKELVTIEPFHGTDFHIYRKTKQGYDLLYACPGGMDFCHVIWTGVLAGKPCVVGACRRGPQSLFLITWENGQCVFTEIDAGVGPSNVDVVHRPDCDIIASANREVGWATFYRVYPD